MTVSLPSISNLMFRNPSPRDEDGESYSSSPVKPIDVHDLPLLQIPLSTNERIQIGHTRRVSTCSLSSAPSLTYSPSPSSSPSPPPSPPPTRSASPEPFLLVPCPMERANAIVIVPHRLGNSTSSLSKPSTRPSHFTPPVFRPCKPSEARALLLIGPAISTHARKSSVRMHPYRIVRERRI